MKIQVFPGTTEIHSDTFAKALGAEMTREETDADVVFFIGINPEMKEIVEKFKAQGKKTVAYWIGTDSLIAIAKTSYRAAVPAFDKHLVVHERIQKELTGWNVESEVLYPCARHQGVETKINQVCVGSYQPTPSDQDMYMYRLNCQVARNHPNLKFIFYGRLTDSYPDLPANVDDFGRIDPDKSGSIYNHVSCIMRIVQHDGNPVGGIEAKQRGLHVIENYPYKGFLYAKSLRELDKILDDPKTHELDDSAWPNFYRTMCSGEHFKKEFIRLTS